MDHIIRMTLLDTFKRELINEEKSDLTIEKYIRDVGAFFRAMEAGDCSDERKGDSVQT